MGKGKNIKSTYVAFAVLLFSFIALEVAPVTSLEANAALRAGLSVIAIGAMMFLAGKAAVTSYKGSFKESLNLGKYALFVASLFFIFSAIGGIAVFYTNGAPSNWVPALIATAFLCLFVGIFEEALFRGLIFNSMLIKNGATKKGIYKAMIISSIIFGFVHIFPVFISFEFLDPIVFLQSLLKTIQTGMMGFFLAAIYLKTKSLWGIAFIHGFNDLLLIVWGNLMSLPTASFLANTPLASYTSAGGEASFMLVIVYLVTILLSIPFITKSIKIVNSLDLPQHGLYEK